jgi:hypothetical protein
MGSSERNRHHGLLTISIMISMLLTASANWCQIVDAEYPHWFKETSTPEIQFLASADQLVDVLVVDGTMSITAWI